MAKEKLEDELNERKRATESVEFVSAIILSQRENSRLFLYTFLYFSFPVII